MEDDADLSLKYTTVLLIIPYTPIFVMGAVIYPAWLLLTQLGMCDVNK